MRCLILIIYFIGFNFVSYSAEKHDTINCNEPKDVLLNSKVPNIDGYTIQGTKIDSNYFVGEVVLLNFMYIGCPPCMSEISTLNKLFDRFNTKGLKVLSIAAHFNGDVKDFMNLNDTIALFSIIRRYFKIDTVKYQVMAECSGDRPSGKRTSISPACKTISSKFNLKGYPLTFLIDKYGVIRFIHSGFYVNSNDDINKMYELYVKEIEELLK